MPLVVLRTNLPASRVDATFADKLVEFLGQTMEAKSEVSAVYFSAHVAK